MENNKKLMKCVSSFLVNSCCTNEFIKLFRDLADSAIMDYDYFLNYEPEEIEQEKENIYDYIGACLDRCLWASSDNWEVMAHYQTPQEANYYNALDDLEDDLHDVILEYMNNLINEKLLDQIPNAED